MNARKRVVMAGAILALGLGVPTAASAQEACYPNCPPPTVPNNIEGTGEARGTGEPGPGTPGTPTRVGGTEQSRDTRSGTGTLPVTGGDIVGLTLIGLGAVAVGTVMTRRSRRLA